MRKSQLVLSIILATLLVGGVSAQPMNQSETLLPAEEQVTETTNPASLLYDNICDTPISMAGSPTEVRYVAAGTCIQIHPSFTCPECEGQNCGCSVTITGGKDPITVWWDCFTGQFLFNTTSFCVYFEKGGEYTFWVDVCDGEQGTIDCDCSGC